MCNKTTSAGVLRDFRDLLRSACEIEMISDTEDF